MDDARQLSAILRWDCQAKSITVKGDADGGLTAVLHQLGSPAEVERFFGWVAANRADALSKEWIVKHDGKEVRYMSLTATIEPPMIGL